MSFLEYFNQHVISIKLVDKDDSWFMKTIAVLLAVGNFLRITNIRDNPHTERNESFMGGYGTTIGHTVYDNPGWAWDLAPNTHVVHELCHVVQASILQGLRYVFSSRWRMFYESECVQAEILCFPGRRSELWFERRVRQFVKYGIKEKIVRKNLTKRIEEIEQAEPRASSARVADAYAMWQNAHAER